MKDNKSVCQTLLLLLFLQVGTGMVKAQQLRDLKENSISQEKSIQSNYRLGAVPGESPIQLQISGKLALCDHSEKGHILLEVQGGVGPYTFLWNNLSTTQNRYNLLAGTYTVTVTDSNGNTRTERILVQPPFPFEAEVVDLVHASCSLNDDGNAKISIKKGRGAPYKVEWSHGLQDKFEGDKLAPGTYEVKIYDTYNCFVTLSFDIKTAAESIEVEESVTQPNCDNNHEGSILLEINGGKAPFTYLWSNGMETKNAVGLSTGNYQVVVEDANGCSWTKAFTIEQSNPLQVKGNVISDLTCFDANTGEIHVEASGGMAPYSFDWSNGEKTKYLKNLSAGSYTLRVKDALGCEIVQEFAIAGPEILTAKIESAYEANCETGQSKGLAWVTIQGGKSPYSIKWNNGSSASREIEFFDSEELSVQITDANGCITSEKLKLNFPVVSTADRLNFNYKKLGISSEEKVSVNESIVFQSEIADEFIAWEWDFGDGVKTMDKDPVHQYEKSGEYVISLRAYDIMGCSSAQQAKIQVAEPADWVIIPNAFTPNGDGLNDFFLPVLRGVVNFQMDVFNHWGEHVHTASGIEIKGWDGYYKGNLLPRGNYVYQISYKTPTGEIHKKSGSVTLIR